MIATEIETAHGRHGSGEWAGAALLAATCKLIVQAHEHQQLTKLLRDFTFPADHRRLRVQYLSSGLVWQVDPSNTAAVQSYLAQIDLARDFVAQADAADGEHHLRRQLLI